MSMPERTALLASVAKPWDGNTYISRWCSGKKDTRGGEVLGLTWTGFGEGLAAYASAVVPKGEGQWFTPAFTKSGGCKDVDISAITQLALDADGVGDWFDMHGLLQGAGLAYLMHRSASHRPDRPKFHAHLPLFLYWSGEKLEWRAIYRHCVGWFSAAAGLSYDFSGKRPQFGFDKATDRKGQPWFPATRRSADAVIGEVICRPGLALDLEQFLEVTGFDADVNPLAKKERRPRARASAQAAAWIPQGPATPTSTPNFLVGLVFWAAGMLGAKVDDGKWCVLCPFRNEHTSGDGLDTSTVVFAPKRPGGSGWFHCSHSHCEGRSTREVLTALPPAAVAAGMAIHRDLTLASVGLYSGGR
jgi:hypothetical protein